MSGGQKDPGVEQRCGLDGPHVWAGKQLAEELDLWRRTHGLP